MTKTILCYGDSNTWGCPPRRHFGEMPRYGVDVRWGSVLRTTLGIDCVVVEEGLGGRTTVWDDPVEGEHKNGKTYLTPCLASHRPLDLVVVMLGTNDLKHRFGLSAADIAAGAAALVDLIHSSGTGPGGTKPGVLLICPPPVGRLDLFASMFEGAAEKSPQLACHFEREANAHGCAFLDAGKVIRSSDIDGIHLEVDAQQILGHAVAQAIKRLPGWPAG
jgi:lysophospholipase L1-like esterase